MQRRHSGALFLQIKYYAELIVLAVATLAQAWSMAVGRLDLE